MSRQSSHEDSTIDHVWLEGQFPEPRHTIDAHLCDLESVLKEFEADWGLNLDPGNQRSHVWPQAQQVAFTEGFLRGTLSSTERLLRFNCPHWDGALPGDLPSEMQIIDGLQRLTAIRRFLAGEVRAFGMSVDDFNGTRYDIRRQGSSSLHIAIHAFVWRHELLQFYLVVNSGGTPHRDVEIARARSLLYSLSKTKA